MYVHLFKKCVKITESSSTDPIGSARLRRHRYNMIITMMFGVTALGAILVPMGFQMLSIVSGKALLLAKMALLLASINGLKRASLAFIYCENSILYLIFYRWPTVDSIMAYIMSRASIWEDTTIEGM